MPLSNTTWTSRTSFDIELWRGAASRLGRYPLRSLRIDVPGQHRAVLDHRKAHVALQSRHNAADRRITKFARSDESCTLAESIRRMQSLTFQGKPGCNCRISHQRLTTKYLRPQPRSVGGRQRRPRYYASDEMMKVAGVALQVALDLTRSRALQWCASNMRPHAALH